MPLIFSVLIAFRWYPISVLQAHKRVEPRRSWNSSKCIPWLSIQHRLNRTFLTTTKIFVKSEILVSYRNKLFATCELRTVKSISPWKSWWPIQTCCHLKRRRPIYWMNRRRQKSKPLRHGTWVSEIYRQFKALSHFCLLLVTGQKSSLVCGIQSVSRQKAGFGERTCIYEIVSQHTPISFNLTLLLSTHHRSCF